MNKYFKPLLITATLILSIGLHAQPTATASPPDTTAVASSPSDSSATTAVETSPADSSATAPSESAAKPSTDVAQVNSSFVVDLASKYPWLTTILLIVGALRALLKPVMSLLDGYVKNKCTPEEYDRLQSFESGPVYKFLNFGLDYLGSVKLPTLGIKPSSNPFTQAAPVVAFGMSLFILTGCASITGNPIIVRAEQSEAIAHSTFSTFLKIDNENRDFWRTNVPALHQFAEYLRQPVVTESGSLLAVPRGDSYILSLDNVKLAYKAGRASSNDVVTALATVETAISEAQKLIAQSQTVNH